MMLKLITGVLTAAFLILAPGLAKANEYSCMPIKTFLEDAAKYIDHSINLTPAHERALLMAFVANQHIALSESMTYNLALARLKDGNYGIVLLRNTCVQTGTARSATPAEFDGLLNDAKISDKEVLV